MMLAMIGTDPQTGTLRWTMDSLYLWDGLPLVPLTLGIFALPELCDLADRRTAVVRRRTDCRHQDRHAARRQGLLHALVPDAALLVDRLGHGRHSRHRRRR